MSSCLIICLKLSATNKVIRMFVEGRVIMGLDTKASK
jgi:hypothetical protein